MKTRVKIAKSPKPPKMSPSDNPPSVLSYAAQVLDPLMPWRMKPDRSITTPVIATLRKKSTFDISNKLFQFLFDARNTKHPVVNKIVGQISLFASSARVDRLFGENLSGHVVKGLKVLAVLRVHGVLKGPQGANVL